MQKETHKPHIIRLPVVDFPNYAMTDTAVAVSIPLFHSDIDSAVLSQASVERLKDVHCKGAIWAAMSLIHNTDLADRGAGIYFHVEDIILDVVMPVFEAFKVPSQHIRSIRINAPELPNKVEHPIFGKKFMCLDDHKVNPARWLISDSDMFACSAEKKLKLYDAFKVFENPSALRSKKSDYRDEYQQWVYGACLAAGLPFFPEDDLFSQEIRAFYTLGLWTAPYRIPSDTKIRPYISTQMFLLPVRHPIVPFIAENYKTCYQDEFLLGMWNMTYDWQISDLREKCGIRNVYNFESAYKNRDKTQDTEGYLAHIVPDTHGPAIKDLDAYYDDFCQHIQQKTSAENRASTQIRLSDAFQATNTDKQHRLGHQYGNFYDMLFESMAYRKQRGLRVLEIGVSLFGRGSMDAFQEVDTVEQVVGIDILAYLGTIGGKAAFHKADAYTLETVEMLKREYPDGFDIIIDDGTHKAPDQRFFFEHYGQLLTEDGQLVCEDVIDVQFFKEACDELNCYGIDGWGNLKIVASPEMQHQERILIRDQKTCAASPVQSEPVIKESTDVSTETAETEKARAKPEYDYFSFINADFREYTPPAKKRFIVLDVPYAHAGFIACAFCQRVQKWSKAMLHLGHEIIYIGHETREVACTKRYGIITDAMLEKSYGSADYMAFPEHSENDLAFKVFEKRAAEIIRDIAQKDDFVLAFYGYGHFDLCQAIADLPVIVVEPSIGYTDVFTENKVYQSVGKMHFERGKADNNAYLLKHYPDHPYNETFRAKMNRLPYTHADRNSCVIPNFFDFDHFRKPEGIQREDRMCFLGRISPAKGIFDAFKLAAYTDTELLVAGVGHLDDLPFDVPKQVEFVGAVDPKNRNKIFWSSQVHVCPSLYLEPFLGSGVESLYCELPHMTSNWGAGMDWCIHGKTGYRVQNFDQMVWAYNNIHHITPQACRHQAIQYSKERAALSYHEYFNMLLQNRNGGYLSVNPERTNLQWLNAEMTETAIVEATVEIQRATGILK